MSSNGPPRSVTGAPAEPPAGLPISDWQFWVVTLIALAAAAWIVRKLLPRRWSRRSKTAAAKRATLTVGGRPVEAVRDGHDCH
ncbi:MAG: hypothetical protein IPJ41_03795 [Phycisphaerales bacterium]|nr:hypothetical protein [Phycisphaerales bacterium]